MDFIRFINVKIFVVAVNVIFKLVEGYTGQNKRSYQGEGKDLKEYEYSNLQSLCTGIFSLPSLLGRHGD
jgi:hypothetical protein